MEQELARINQEIRICILCRLAATRSNPVCGEGNPGQGIMLVGQAPGETEDRDGRMFTGPSGKLLDQLLSSAGILRNEVYMTNLIKCYIPKCRRPSKNEIAQCSFYLNREIGILRPRLIAPLGFHATRYIFRKYGIERPPGKEYHLLFGKIVLAGSLRILPLRHPTALLFNPGKRRIIQANYNSLRAAMDYPD